MAKIFMNLAVGISIVLLASAAFQDAPSWALGLYGTLGVVFYNVLDNRK